MSDGKPASWLKEILLPSLQALAIGGAIMWGGITFLLEMRAVASDVTEIKADAQATNARVERLYEILVYPKASQ